MDKKKARLELKQHRIMKYFIEATDEIIKKNGIDAVTIRNVSDLAGYTSATLYNYFDNLSHLIFLATLDHLKNYHETLPNCIKNCKNSIDLYLTVCKCFSQHAYSEPTIYELLFFSDHTEKYEEYTQQYFKLYPKKENKKWTAILQKIFHKNNMHERSYAMLELCIKDGFIDTQEEAKDFNDICLRFNKTIIQDVKDEKLDRETAVSLTLRYYYKIFKCFLTPKGRVLLEDSYSKLLNQ